MKQAETDQVAFELALDLRAGDGDFFPSLVTYLALGLEADCALLLEMTQDQDRARTLAARGGAEMVPGTMIPLADLERDRLMERMNMESCIVAGLHDSAGRVLGILALLWREPGMETRTAHLWARTFAARAAAEIERRRLERSALKLAVIRGSIPHPVLELSYDGRLLFHNRAAAVLARSLGCDDPIRILPRDTAGIITKCLAGGGNGVALDTPGQDRTIVWSFIPLPEERGVYAQAFELSLFLDLQKELNAPAVKSPGARAGAAVKAPRSKSHKHRSSEDRVH